MNTEFSIWLGREIESRLMTRLSFAEALGVHKSTLHGWLAGRSVPTGLSIARLARTLGVDRRVIEEKLGETIAA